MCTINTLVQEKYGYIATCEEYKVFYLTFGNFSMQLQEDYFRVYMGTIGICPHKNDLYAVPMGL